MGGRQGVAGKALLDALVNQGGDVRTGRTPLVGEVSRQPLLRIVLADMSTRPQLQVALDQVKANADAITEVGRIGATEYLEGTAPFQDQVHVRALVLDFLWHHAMKLRSWAERTESTLDRPGARSL